MLLDEFGNELPTRREQCDAIMEIMQEPLAMEIMATLEAQQRIAESFSGPRLFGADGERVHTGTAIVVGSKGFRVPFSTI